MQRRASLTLARYVLLQGDAYARLAERAFDDGVEHGAGDAKRPVPPLPPGVRAHRLAHLFAFYHPSIGKMHRELVKVVKSNRKDLLDLWFDQNGYRLELAIGGLSWAAGEAGRALGISAPGAGARPVNWLDEGDDKVCWMCQAFAAGSPYPSYQALPTTPGAGMTPCGANCRCRIEPA